MGEARPGGKAYGPFDSDTFSKGQQGQNLHAATHKLCTRGCMPGTSDGARNGWHTRWWRQKVEAQQAAEAEARVSAATGGLTRRDRAFLYKWAADVAAVANEKKALRLDLDMWEKYPEFMQRTRVR